MTRLAAFAALILFGVNCGGGGGTENNDPTPGDLTIELTSPNTDDGAIKLIIVSPVTPTAISSAAAGVEIFTSGPLSTSTTVIVTGDLSAGPLLHITVPDTRDDEDYAATVVQVASATYAIRTNTGYALDVTK
jgi:hypothetical protein